MYDQYTQRIYSLLDQYLPRLESTINSIDDGVADILSFFDTVGAFLNEYKILLLIIAICMLLGRFVSKEWLS